MTATCFLHILELFATAKTRKKWKVRETPIFALLAFFMGNWLSQKGFGPQVVGSNPTKSYIFEKISLDFIHKSTYNRKKNWTFGLEFSLDEPLIKSNELTDSWFKSQHQLFLLHFIRKFYPKYIFSTIKINSVLYRIHISVLSYTCGSNSGHYLLVFHLYYLERTWSTISFNFPA